MKQGLSSVAPEKLTNDIVDLEYVILGALSAGLVTNDGKARDAYYRLCEIADARWDWLRDFYCSKGVAIWP